MTPDNDGLRSLFYAGDHREVLRRTLDSPSGAYARGDVAIVVGALVFVGRASEAQTLFRDWSRTWDRTATADVSAFEDAAACRFYLCIAECRAGRVTVGIRLARATLADLGVVASARMRFHFHQSMGISRHFAGAIASAARHAARARRYALEARFPYGRMLALDLLGHTLVLRGRVLAGLVVLVQAKELADDVGLASFASTTQAAIAAYRADFGIAGERAVAELDAQLALLAHAGEPDRYSRRLLLVALARTHAIRGSHDAAKAVLAAAEELALPDGDRRAQVRLCLAQALAEGLAQGEEAAAPWLDRASEIAEVVASAALDAEIIWYESIVAKARLAARPREALEALARTTGIHRLAQVARAEAPARDDLASEDRFAALVHAAAGASGVARVVESGALGLLPNALGRRPGQRIVILRGPRLLVIEDHGNVVRRALPTDATLAVLTAIARGSGSKEALVTSVWGLKIYRPDKHDSVVHTAISRLRVALDPRAGWIVIGPNGYELARDVELVDPEAVGEAPSQVPIGDARASLEPAPPADDDRRQAIVALASAKGGVSTRDVAARLRVSEMTALRLLGAMTSEGILRRVGRGRGTRYEVIE